MPLLGQGLRGWSDILTIYNQLNDLASANDEELPNYQVSWLRRLVRSAVSWARLGGQNTSHITHTGSSLTHARSSAVAQGMSSSRTYGTHT